VAERFLKLSPDEIYELAHRASTGDSDPPERTRGDLSPDAPKSSASPAFLHASGEAESFHQIVQTVTAALATELKLPAFDAWRASYESSPEQYDDELLGLWRESL
jgi:hypothetical protein